MEGRVGDWAGSCGGETLMVLGKTIFWGVAMLIR